MFLGMFKKKKDENETPKTVARVLDKHLGSYVKIAIAHKLMLTALVSFGFLMTVNAYINGGIMSLDAGHIAMIQLRGAISEGNTTGSGVAFAAALDKAAQDKNAKAILIRASSGGGSPTQAEIMYEALREYTAKPLSERKEVIVSVQDMCASACLAAVISADKIYLHRNSLFGSIGVRMDTYGLDEIMDKVGVTKDVLTSVPFKDYLDPYRTRTDAERDFIKTSLINPLHTVFVDMVKEARGDKLQGDTQDILFSGLVWVGQKGVDLGLADSIKTTVQVEAEMKSQYNVKEIKAYNRESFSLMGALTSSIENAVYRRLTNSEFKIH